MGRCWRRVINYSPTPFIQQVTINKELSSGIHQFDPVVTGDGVVGVVGAAFSDTAVVTLISNSGFAVAARDNLSGANGVLQPQSGSPGTLEFNYADPQEVSVGDSIVTAGEVVSKCASHFPANLPIGTVTQSSSSQTGQILVSPSVNLDTLDSVQVLTRVPQPSGCAE